MGERKSIGNFNGWANYETWAVNLWLDNDEDSYRYWSRMARAWSGDEQAAWRLADQLRGEVTEAAPELGNTLYADLMNAALSDVDWVEIAECMLEAATEGWPSDEDSCDC